MEISNLTGKQQKFCDEYLIDLNATQAAIRAGYSEKTAQQIGAENLLKPVIQNYISEKQLNLQKKTGITTERVLAEYAKIAFFDIRKAFNEDGGMKPVSELDDDTAAAIAGIEVYEETAAAGEETFKTGETKKIKVADKIRALDSLGKHLGIFEKDNSQKTPLFNIENLEISDLNNLLSLQKKAGIA